MRSGWVEDFGWSNVHWRAILVPLDPEATMTVKQKSTDQPELRTCQRCGLPLPPQKSGRPRRWCSQQCRQAAYEELHGLESWKDKQPKPNDLSDVVEV